MKETEAILKRQKYAIRFKNEDMDFMLNWFLGVGQVVGLSHGEIFYAIHAVKDGDPQDWRAGFNQLGYGLIRQAQEHAGNGRALAAGRAYFGAAYAIRSALQFTDPTDTSFSASVKKMEFAFQTGVECLRIPLKPIAVSYTGKMLAGYYLEHDHRPRPTLLMVGGGDTFCEDLFPFAGYPGWKRGYNVLMVDLPGQGMNPAQGLHFEVDASQPIKAVLDWLEAHAAAHPQQIAVYGVSGGGYFSAQAAAAEPRIKAWVASTPIFDIAKTFEREFGAALKTPTWILNTLTRVAGSLNESAEINLRKYAWQFGTTDFKTAVDAVLQMAKPVDYTKISCPMLFLIGENEAGELKRQAQVLYEYFIHNGQPVTLREFTAAEGADAHCQVNNLRLAHQVIFDWLDDVFDYPQNSDIIDTRLLF